MSKEKKFRRIIIQRTKKLSKNQVDGIREIVNMDFMITKNKHGIVIHSYDRKFSTVDAMRIADLLDMRYNNCACIV